MQTTSVTRADDMLEGTVSAAGQGKEEGRGQWSRGSGEGEDWMKGRRRAGQQG